MDRSDDRQLIEKARHGDRPAMEHLLMNHHEVLRDHIARRLPSKLQSTVAIEDVMQEALFDACQKIDRLRDTSPQGFATWIKAIGEVTLLKFMRSESAQKRGGGLRRLWHKADSVTGTLLDLVDQLPGESLTGSRAASREEAAYALQVAIAGLPADQREAINLHLLKGMTLDDTATTMSRTPAAIRGLVHRGKQNLAEAMGRASAWLSGR